MFTLTFQQKHHKKCKIKQQTKTKKMLRAIQMMINSSTIPSSSTTTTSVILANRIKLQQQRGLFLFSNSISTNYNSPLFFSLPKTPSFKPFTRMSSTRNESNSVAPSSSFISANIRKVKFCQSCGGATKHEIPDGDEKLRAICTLCGNITYQNPKMVVGCLIEHDNKILLCKRNIQPSYGRWTLPAGYMEMGESAADGAIRETQEEAGAEVEVVSPFAQLDIPLIGQTYIIFLAKLKTPKYSPGVESMECRLFALDDIPFDALAFSSMVVSLKLYIEDLKDGKPKFHYGTINKRPGTSPSDINAFTLDYHLVLP